MAVYLGSSDVVIGGNMPTNIDKLFALKAVEQKVTEERKMLEYECRDELLEALGKDGTDRRTSPMFGPDAGKFSIKRMKGKPEVEVLEYCLDDDVAFAEWLEGNIGAAVSYAKEKYKEFSRAHFEATGEVPDGIEVVKRVEPGTEPSVTAQVYSFKPDIVIERLGGNLLESANNLLLGEADE